MSNGALAAAGAPSAPTSPGKKNHCPRTALISGDAAAGMTATLLAYLRVQLGQLFLVQVGLSIHPLLVAKLTQRNGGEGKENQVSISHGWPLRGKAGLHHGRLTHGRGP